MAGLTCKTFVAFTKAVVAFSIAIAIVFAGTNGTIGTNKVKFTIGASFAIANACRCIASAVRGTVVGAFGMFASIAKMFVTVMAKTFTSFTIANTIVGTGSQHIVGGASKFRTIFAREFRFADTVARRVADALSTAFFAVGTNGALSFVTMGSFESFVTGTDVTAFFTITIFSRTHAGFRTRFAAEPGHAFAQSLVASTKITAIHFACFVGTMFSRPSSVAHACASVRVCGSGSGVPRRNGRGRRHAFTMGLASAVAFVRAIVAHP